MNHPRDAMARARKAAGMSQEDLGSRIGISRQAINMIETGAGGPSLRNALRIAKVLGRSVEGLFSVPSAHGKGDRIQE